MLIDAMVMVMVTFSSNADSSVSISLMEVMGFCRSSLGMVMAASGVAVAFE